MMCRTDWRVLHYLLQLVSLGRHKLYKVQFKEDTENGNYEKRYRKYKLLGILLEKDKKKLERYIEKRPSCYSGKIMGQIRSSRMKQEDLLLLGVRSMSSNR